MLATGVQNGYLWPGCTVWPVLAHVQKWGECPIIVTAHVHIPERHCNVAHQPLCLFATLPAEVYGKRYFHSSKSLSFVTVASRIEVDVTFLTRYDVTSLIMRL